MESCIKNGRHRSNVTLEPEVSLPDKGSQSVKQSYGTKISMGRPNFEMPAWGNVIFANLLTTTKMEWVEMPRLKILRTNWDCIEKIMD